MRSLPANSVDLILTDPPYGNTALHFDQNFTMDWGAFFSEAWRILREKNRPLLMFAGGMFQAEMKYVWRQWFRYEWVWVKTMPTAFLNAKVRPMSNHEQILEFSQEAEYVLTFGQMSTSTGAHKNTLRYYPQMGKGEAYAKNNNGETAHFNKYTANHTDNPEGTRYPTTTLHFSNSNYGSEHPSQKPQELLRYLLKTYTLEGDVVVDPFCGSGSTGVACATLGRSYIMGDVHPPYIETARRRVANTPYNAKFYEAENMSQPSLLEGLE
jgi:site-specific DNA-methyltransferase (adenine-specific)